MFEAGGGSDGPQGLGDDELLSALAAAQRSINQLTARQLQYAAEFARRRPAPVEPEVPGGERAGRGQISEFAAAEIACVLTISRHAADRLLDTALDLERLPGTTAAFTAGELDLPRVRLLCAGTGHLDDGEAAAVEARVLDAAPDQVYSSLRRSLRRAVQNRAPAAEQRRRAQIVEDRSTWVEHDADGRSRFLAEGPTHEVLRLAAAVDAVGRTLDPDVATLTQRRFDALTSLADTILDDPGLPRTRFGPPGLVLLADIATLARLRGETPGRGAHPGQETADAAVELAGDGPIPDSLAVELLEAAHTVVVPFHTAAGWVCDHTLGYSVPDRLARHVAGTFPRCVFPSCAVPAHRCDWDHVVPAPEGPTCACNLVPLCRYHHRLKTHSRWQLTLHPGRRVEWISPTGRRYTVHANSDTEPGTSTGTDAGFGLDVGSGSGSGFGSGSGAGSGPGSGSGSGSGGDPDAGHVPRPRAA